jgi:hypothetical protein
VGPPGSCAGTETAVGEEAGHPSLWWSPHWSSSGVSPQGGVNPSGRGRTPPVGRGASRATGSSRPFVWAPRSAGRCPGRFRRLLPVRRDTQLGHYARTCPLRAESVGFGLVWGGPVAQPGSGRAGRGGSGSTRWRRRSTRPSSAVVRVGFGVDCLAGGTGRPIRAGFGGAGAGSVVRGGAAPRSGSPQRSNPVHQTGPNTNPVQHADNWTGDGGAADLGGWERRRRRRGGIFPPAYGVRWCGFVLARRGRGGGGGSCWRARCVSPPRGAGGRPLGRGGLWGGLGGPCRRGPFRG